jgi:hypothetical protein
MNKLASLLLIILAVSILAGCSPNEQTQSSDKVGGLPIKPGDTVDGFTVTTAGEEAVQKIFDFWESDSCKQQGNVEIYICQIATGEKVVISLGIYADRNSGKSMETVWDEHTYEIFINDRPVDLAAFGSIDSLHPRVGPMRLWNIAIQADKPAEIVVRGKGMVHGKPVGDTTTYIASEP